MAVGREPEHGVVDSGTRPQTATMTTDSEVDDDGRRPKRTGTVWTASAHILTTVVGAGVLSLPWALSQLGWLIGLTALVLFTAVTLYTSSLLADCYRSPDPVNGKRNRSYMEAVQNILGGRQYIFLGLVQYISLFGSVIGYTITTAISLVAIKKSNCFHGRGHNAPCRFAHNPYMIGLGIAEIFFSQIPNFHELSWLSTVAAITSFGYTFIGIGLSLAQVILGKGKTTSFTGISMGLNTTLAHKIWSMLIAFGNIALASSYTLIAIDIQDTLRSSPPENVIMKTANKMGLTVMLFLFILCGSSGYAAFGDETPGNILTGFGFYEPFWLVDFANVLIVVHLVGAYQVLAQPVYSLIEKYAAMKWPESMFITSEYPVGFGKVKFRVNFFRLTWRTAYVTVVTVLAMAMPFFNAMLALLGAIGFWPLVVYFPVQMHIAQTKTGKRTFKWFGLQILNMLCFFVSLAAACSAIYELSSAIRKIEPFNYKA